MKIGSKALDIYDTLISQKTNALQKSTDEFRVFFKKEIQKPAALRRLILKGYCRKRPTEEILETAKQIITEFCNNIPQFCGSVSSAFEVLKLGKSCVTDEAALSIYYIMLICSYIENSLENKEIQNLSQLVFDGNKLKSTFSNSELAHADLLLTRIARTINSSQVNDQINHYKYDTASMSHTYFGEFLFNIDVANDVSIEPVPYLFRSTEE